MDLNYIRIGERIAAARKARGEKQYVLARRCYMSPQHLCQIENANTKMSLAMFVDICNALGVTADSLLCDVVTSAGEKCKNDNINAVFDDATVDETRLMLAVADTLKTMLRENNKTYRKKWGK